MEPRKHYFAKIPTIAIFIVMAMSGPLGVLLFILKGIDQKMQKNAAKSAFDTLDEETKASMLSGGDEIEKTLNEIETNNLKKNQK